MIHIVGYTQNKVPVHVNLIKSEAAKHIARQPHLLSLAAEALEHIVADTLTAQLEHDMGRVIGYDFVVETTANDAIFYAQLVQDNVYTRFTKNGKSASTARLSLILERSHEDDPYELRDIWVGHLSPPRPGDASETAESHAYWEGHALVFENQPIQAQTLTKTRPY